MEAKRVGQSEIIKGQIFELIELLNDERKEGFYQKVLRKDKVTFDQNFVMILNRQIDHTNIMGYERNLIPQDSLQSIVNAYNTEQKKGLGFVQIMECF